METKVRAAFNLALLSLIFLTLLALLVSVARADESLDPHAACARWKSINSAEQLTVVETWIAKTLRSSQTPAALATCIQAGAKDVQQAVTNVCNTPADTNDNVSLVARIALSAQVQACLLQQSSR